MGKKANWFGVVKKVFSPDSKGKKSKEKKVEVLDFFLPHLIQFLKLNRY